MNFTQYKTKEAFLKDYPITFPNIDNVGMLDLSNKGITDDDLKHIVELLGNELSLKYLFLYNNQLTEIHPNTFKGLSSLVRLDLSYNKISYIHPDTFKGLGSLKWLNLAGNQLTEIHPDTFKSLSSLKWLNLRDNQLTEIHPDTFKGLSSLELLYLYDNQLTQLHKSITEMLPDCSIYTNDNIEWVDDMAEEKV